jgi:poly(3-hydroxybutyrate) depolymerase
VVESLLAERGKADWNIDSVTSGGKDYPVSIDVATERPFGDLVHFRKVGARSNQPRVLLVAPMSGHFATLLRDTVRAMLNEHDVWITDWRDAAEVPLEEGTFGLEDYISYVMDFLGHLHEEAPDRPVHVMAVCQPAPLVLAATALLADAKAPQTPSSMILMGGPVDTGAAPTAVTRMAENRSMSWFQRHVIHHVPARFPGSNRQVYPGFLQLRAFMSMNPARHAGAHWTMFRHLSRGDGESAERTQAFYDEYMSVADVPADFFLETVDHVFKRRSLANGTLTWNGTRVRPEAITDIGLMTIEGELDDISAPAQTEAAHDICPAIPEALREHLMQPNVGHYGIFNGRRWREEICPQIGSFIRRIEAGNHGSKAA